MASSDFTDRVPPPGSFQSVEALASAHEELLEAAAEYVNSRPLEDNAYATHSQQAVRQATRDAVALGGQGDLAVSLYAIDPGATESAFVRFDHPGGSPVEFGKLDNAKMRDRVYNGCTYDPTSVLVIEMIASYGMPVGREVFETCVWIGRFIEAWGAVRFDLVYRRDVKLHLCGSARAKDASVRQALIDKWGGKEKAIGKKKTPGPLYGVSADVWSALAIAVTWSETLVPRESEAA